MTEAYGRLSGRMRDIALVESASGLMSWDQETYLPAKATAYRADQLAFCGGWSHRQFTATDVGDWLKACEDAGMDPDGAEGVNVREWRRRYDRQVKVPTELVEAFERAKALSREAWVAARARSDFELFRPHLETIVDFSRRLADCRGYEASPYDALLEEYERGTTTAFVEALFGSLGSELSAMIGPATERSAGVPEDALAGDYPVAGQGAFNRDVAAALGFDFDAGRIDTTTHPFCTTLGPKDCRITTRYDARDFAQSLYGTMHEAGHGLYEQGLPEAHYGTPRGSAVSMGIHESQSRLWENHVGRRADFWEYWHERASRHLPSLRRLDPARVHAAVNRVRPSFIRVEADQVTYDLHIVLRFEVERRLIEGELKAGEVPGMWNERFEALFGLRVPDDARGCLQDIHWSLGAFGYFPTYTLGNLNAAQLFRCALREESGLRAALARGEYGGLLSWLRRKVHSEGCRLKPQALMRSATGEATRPEYHLDHLRAAFMGGDAGNRE